MLDDYRRRDASYERVRLKPHRQAALREMETWLAEQFTERLAGRSSDFRWSTWPHFWAC